MLGFSPCPGSPQDGQSSPLILALEDKKLGCQSVLPHTQDPLNSAVLRTASGTFLSPLPAPPAASYSCIAIGTLSSPECSHLLPTPGQQPCILLESIPFSSVLASFPGVVLRGDIFWGTLGRNTPSHFSGVVLSILTLDEGDVRCWFGISRHTGDHILLPSHPGNSASCLGGQLEHLRGN